MGVTKETVAPGNGSDRPKKGDNITMEYTGFLYDHNAPSGRGKQYAASSQFTRNEELLIDRQIRLVCRTRPFSNQNWCWTGYQRYEKLENTQEQALIREGWDEGVPQMSLGEKAILTITG